jgi:hypothetical protein
MREGWVMGTIRVNDFFEQYQDGDDCTAAVFEALQECKKTNNLVLSFEQGTYHFKADKAFEKYMFVSNNDQGLKRIVFPLFGMEGLTVDGNGSDFIFHDRIMPFAIEHSKDISLKNFSIDYNRPLYTQGHVVDTTERYIDVKIDKEKYPFKVVDDKLVLYSDTWEMDQINSVLEFDANTKAPKFGCEDLHIKNAEKRDAIEQTVKAEMLDDGAVRLFLSFQKKIPDHGSILSIKHEPRLNPTVVIHESENVKLDSIFIYHSGSMGVVGQLSKNIYLRNVQVASRPGSDRVVSACADATHFVNCRGNLILEDCLFENQLDDHTNVHGNFLRLHKQLSDRCIYARIMHHMQRGIDVFKAGDEVKFVDRMSLLDIGCGIVKSSSFINQDFVKIEFEEPIPEGVSLEDGIENISAVPDVTIQNCRGGKNRARGYVIKTPGKVLIENCDLYTEGMAILLMYDVYFWHESGGVRDLTIRNNHLRSLNASGVYGPAVININAKVQEEKGTALHQNITIDHNTLETVDKDVVHARYVKNLDITNNRIVVRPKIRNKVRVSQIKLSNCDNVVFSANRIDAKDGDFEFVWDQETCTDVKVF